MTQFTAQSLARLLLNVDREILRKAVKEADLWDVFSSFERESMTELGQAFNFLANLDTFGPAILDLGLDRYLDSVRQAIEVAPLPARILLATISATLSAAVFTIEALSGLEPREVSPELAEIFAGGMAHLETASDRLSFWASRTSDMPNIVVITTDDVVNQGLAEMRRFRAALNF